MEGYNFIKDPNNHSFELNEKTFKALCENITDYDYTDEKSEEYLRYSLIKLISFKQLDYFRKYLDMIEESSIPLSDYSLGGVLEYSAQWGCIEIFELLAKRYPRLLVGSNLEKALNGAMMYCETEFVEWFRNRY